MSALDSTSLSPLSNSSFSKRIPELQLAWDSTSLKALKTCARFYQYTIVEGWVPRALSAHLTFGLLYHGALERYDHAKAKGASYDEACVVAVRWALQQTWDKALNRPWLSDIPEKNRFTLVRTIIWYLEQFREDPMETIILDDGKPAVELSFRFYLDVKTLSTGEDYVYCGHLDRLATFQGEAWIGDRKTTKHALDDKYWAQFSPHIQFSGYTLGGQITYHQPIAGLMVDAAQIGVGFSRFMRSPVGRTTDQLKEFYRGALGYLSYAEGYASMKDWPMNEESCGNYGGCSFRGICGRSPAVRQEWLEKLFVKRVWDPLQTRGDI